jgi:hypothetical protein
MIRRSSLALVVLTLLAPLPALAVEQGSQAWLLVTGTGSFAGQGLWYAEVQPRFDLEETEPGALLVRGALGYRLTPAFSLWAGYAWTPALSPLRHEHRPFQQALFETTVGGIRIINRTRLEQRFLEQADGMSLRARNMLRAVLPLGASGWAIAAYDELFVNANGPTGAPPDGWDQNRAFLGINRRVHPNLVVEAGYIAQLVFAARPDRLNHVALVWLAMNL